MYLNILYSGIYWYAFCPYCRYCMFDDAKLRNRLPWCIYHLKRYFNLLSVVLSLLLALLFARRIPC